MNRLYPLFVKLEGRFCLIAGGGDIAAWKVQGLRDAGALVTIVSPTLVEPLAALRDAGLIRWIPREFEPDDLDGAFLVVSATDDPEVSSVVFAEAEARGVLCNAVDQDDYCSFHVPAIAHRGDIKIAVSTAGRSPAFASYLKRRIQDALSEDDATFVRGLGDLRARVFERHGDPESRKRIFQSLVDAYAGHAAPARRARSPYPGDTTPARPGSVALVGAGPGAGGLLTVRGALLIESADVVFYDRLVGREVIDWIPAEVEKVYVGKEVGKNNPMDTGRVIAETARAGKAVVRLKGGDPSLFGRGGDEMLALMELGVPFEIVPGVSALTAVPSAAGIPVTFRDLSHQVVVRSGYRVPGESSPSLTPPSPAESTYVYFMTVGRLSEIVAELRERDGLDDATPIAIVQRGTLPDQRVLHGTLGTILEQANRAPLTPPALVIAGAVVRFAARDASAVSAASEVLQ